VEDKKLNEQLKADIRKIKTIIANDGIEANNNLDNLYKLIDIEKDICEIEKESEEMRYGEYGRNNYGRYNDYGREDYGRRSRDSRGRYMGHDHIDKMYNEYGRYEEGREQYNRGNYGAKDDTLRSLEYMLESMVDFVKMLKEEAGSQEEINLIREYTKKISDM